MALAPFFAKAALSATSLMGDVSKEAFRSIVEPLKVAVEFDAAAQDSAEGQVCLELLTNLLSRLYPKLRIASRGCNSAFLHRLHELALEINPNVEFVSSGEEVNACVVVGQAEGGKADFTVFLGSDRWSAHVSVSRPQDVGRSRNPFGAAGAACFGAAYVFRHFFHSYLKAPYPNQDFSVSLASYTFETNGGGADCDGDLGEFAIAGIGAIGNATVWALARTDCSGTVHLVDGELVDDTNPQRYVLTSAKSAGTLKVSIAEQVLAGSKLKAVPHPDMWSGFISKRPGWNIPLVATALDSAHDRCAVQSSLPGFVVNAWTQTGDLGVSRHQFLGSSSCLACLYWPRKQRKNEDEIVKEAIGFTGELMEVRNMLYTRAGLDDAWLDRLSADMKVPREVLEPFKGKPLKSLYQEGICAGAIATMGTKKVEVPLAFQSAMAGIMLAAEILKHAEPRQLHGGIVTTKLDLLRPLGTMLSEKAVKPAELNCICKDPVYIARYKQKYG